MMFFDQFKVPWIKFGKCFAEFVIPIALIKKFGSQEFVTIIEVNNMRRCSGKAKLQSYRSFAMLFRVCSVIVIEKTMNRNWSNQKANSALKTKVENK